MGKIARFAGNLKAFASAALGTERTVFGDVVQSDTLDANLTADFERGWGIVGVNENPTKQDFNAVAFAISQVLAYMHQIGVPEWHTAQEFQTNGITNKAGVLYISQVDANIGNDPAADSGANWVPFLDNALPSAAVTPATDADVTLTFAQYTKTRLVLADGAWTTGRNIVVPDAERTYFVDNSAGSYTATVKTAAGAGVAVLPGASAILACDGVDVLEQVIGTPPGALRYGLTPSNNGAAPLTTLDISTGQIEDSTRTRILALAALFSKTTSAWAVGSGNGGGFAGALGASTWYHVFLIRKASDGSIDAGFDSSITAANRPAGYPEYRRIGSILTDASSQILAFNATEMSDGAMRVMWDTPIVDSSGGGLAVVPAATRITVSTPPGVPCRAIFDGNIGLASLKGHFYLKATSMVAFGNAVLIAETGFQDAFHCEEITDASAQVDIASNSASSTHQLQTRGYVDYRR